MAKQIWKWFAGLAVVGAALLHKTIYGWGGRHHTDGYEPIRGCGGGVRLLLLPGLSVLVAGLSPGPLLRNNPRPLHSRQCGQAAAARQMAAQLRSCTHDSILKH